jgi:putative ABC transport system permease protein
MKLTSKLSLAQIKKSKRLTFWTVLGIIFTTAMFAAVSGFVASGIDTVEMLMGKDVEASSYYLSLFQIGILLGLVIFVVSVIVISNAFRVSASERTKQFGILKSVGATKKQITQIVVHEGFLVSLIGIPLGLLLGIGIEYIGVLIVRSFIDEFRNNFNGEGEVDFLFTVSWISIGASVVIALVTVLVSAYLPARKAAKISAIDSIRETTEIKYKNNKKLRTSFLTKLLFGYEGVLASKSIKRNSRNFRSTWISLTISIVLILTASGIQLNISRMNSILNPSYMWSVSGQVMRLTDENKPGLQTEVSKEKIDEMTAKLQEKSTGEVRCIGTNCGLGHTYINTSKKMLTPIYRKLVDPDNKYSTNQAFDLQINLMTVDNKYYEKLCEMADVPIGSNILLNDYRGQGEKRGSLQTYAKFEPFVYDGQSLTVYTDVNGNVSSEVIKLDGELSVDEVPEELMSAADNYVNIVVAEKATNEYIFAIDTENPDDFVLYTEELMEEYFPTENYHTNAYNIEEANRIVSAIGRIIMTFIYGFAVLLTLIGLTNVISTISTNIRSRGREFAVLRSVGMTSGGIRKMLALESILCGIKSILIGVPIGVGLTYLVYLFLMSTINFAYQFPLWQVVGCITGVFAVTFVTMQVSAKGAKVGIVREIV